MFFLLSDIVICNSSLLIHDFFLSLLERDSLEIVFVFLYYFLTFWPTSTWFTKKLKKKIKKKIEAVSFSRETHVMSWRILLSILSSHIMRECWANVIANQFSFRINKAMTLMPQKIVSIV